jgi:hypothetical protein
VQPAEALAPSNEADGEILGARVVGDHEDGLDLACHGPEAFEQDRLARGVEAVLDLDARLLAERRPDAVERLLRSNRRRAEDELGADALLLEVAGQTRGCAPSPWGERPVVV